MIRLSRLIKSFTYAWRGLIKIAKEEQNIKIHLITALGVILAGSLFGIERIEWCLLVIVMGFVILMETINSAVERITDVLRPRINDYVKEIKDITAAAVMLSAIFAVIVGLIIFFPYVISKN
jgi:diacylglycerol kinase